MIELGHITEIQQTIQQAAFDFSSITIAQFKLEPDQHRIFYLVLLFSLNIALKLTFVLFLSRFTIFGM